MVFSRAKRPGTPYPRNAWFRLWGRSFWWNHLLNFLHFSLAAGRAVCHAIWPNSDGFEQHDWHRQHLRVCGENSLQCGGMGEEYSRFPRASSHGPSGSPSACLVRTLCVECSAMQHATPYRTPPRCRGVACQPHGRRQGGGFYGPHQNLPRTGREAEGFACGRRWV